MAEFTRSTSQQWATPDHGAERFDFIVRVHGGRARIELFGELDSATAPTLARRIDGLLGRFEHLELDLTYLEFLGAAGVALIAEAAGRLGPNGTIALMVPSRGVLRLLDIVTFPECVRIESAAPAAPARDHDALAEA